MVDKEPILQKLREHFECSGEITIDDHGLVSVAGDVRLTDHTIAHFPPEVQFDKVTGFFQCDDAPELVSLKGSPKTVGEDFWCREDPKLNTLEGLPENIGGMVILTWKPTLPLLRCLVAKRGAIFLSSPKYPRHMVEPVTKIFSWFKGQGRAGAFDCRRDLRAAGYEGNARW